MNYNGIVVVNAKNANFNAGFDGLPRRLPNGKIFATDKALKYCIREYLSKEEPIFVHRTKEFHTDEDKYLFTWDKISEKDIEKLIKFIEQNFSFDWIKKAKIEKIDNDNTIKFSTEKNYLSLILNEDKTKVYLKNGEDLINEFILKTEKGKQNIYEKGGVTQRYLTLRENYLKKCQKTEIPKDEKAILVDLLKFIDVRLFGVVFAVDSNISLTGPCQINYGVNRYDKSSIFSSNILSPYRNPNEKSKDAQQTTIGEESRADDVYYVYDICLNMNSAEKQNIEIKDTDIEKLKKALKYAVGWVNSTTMFGCETVSMLWFKNEQDKIFNNLNSLVDIYDLNNEVIINYSKVIKLVNSDIDKTSLENYSSKVKNLVE